MYEPQPQLGRLYAPDVRDRQFMLTPPRQQAETVAYRYWYHDPDDILDQDESSACTGFSAEYWNILGPIRNLRGPGGHEIYRAAQKVDEWPGEEPAYYGSSVRAAFKVLKSLGYVEKYGWAFDLETAVNHVLTVSPMVFGTDWYAGMMQTDEHGFVHATGRVVGGHAYAIKGASRIKACPDGSVGAFRGIQSWGAAWGQKGLFWLSFKDAAKLIADQGECVTAYETKPA